MSVEQTIPVELEKHTKGQGIFADMRDGVDSILGSIVSKSKYVPIHIAFIMDGNRRYAKKHKLEKGDGHVHGFQNMLSLLQACHFMGVKTVSVYAFSIENFNRSPEESEMLFNMIRKNMWEESSTGVIKQLGWRIKFVGRRSMFEDDILEKIEQIEELTKDGKSMVVNICAPYTTRDDICGAVIHAAKAYQDDKSINVLNKIESSRYIDVGMPLDIMIRTSGATRFSDFMSWESDSNCMVSFIPEYWPELTATRLYRIVIQWQMQYAMRRENDLSFSKLQNHPPLLSVSDKKKAK